MSTGQWQAEASMARRLTESSRTPSRRDPSWRLCHSSNLGPLFCVHRLRWSVPCSPERVSELLFPLHLYRSIQLPLCMCSFVQYTRNSLSIRRPFKSYLQDVLVGTFGGHPEFCLVDPFHHGFTIRSVFAWNRFTGCRIDVKANEIGEMQDLVEA